MDVLGFENNYHSQIFEIVSKERKQVLLLGDFDINLLNYNDHQSTSDFVDSLVSNSFIPYILHPARITIIQKISLTIYFPILSLLK